MSRAIAFSLKRNPPRGICSLCCAPVSTVVAAGAGGPQFYGFCLRCVAGMQRVARAARVVKITKGA